MLEKTIEQALVKRVKELGGTCDMDYARYLILAQEALKDVGVEV